LVREEGGGATPGGWGDEVGEDSREVARRGGWDGVNIEEQVLRHAIP
jgi:hypothetical protein